MKLLWFVGGLFFLIGLGMLAGGGALYRSNQRFEAIAKRAEGTVVDFERYQSTSGSGSSKKSKTMYKTVVRFSTEDGRSIDVVGSTGSSSPGYSRGDKVKVLYEPGTPERAEIDSFMERKFGVLMLTGMGAIFTLVGAGILAAQIRKRRVNAWLDQHGMTVQATFTGIDQDTSVAVNNRHPWRLNAQWQHPATGAVHVFHSDSVWFDPTPYVTSETLNVKVNADDPSQYRVDISFLPKKG